MTLPAPVNVLVNVQESFLVHVLPIFVMNARMGWGGAA